MSTSFDEYRTRVLGYLGDRDPVRVQAATPRRVERMVEGVARSVLVRRPAPGKWCIAEIVAHMADAELAMGWRLRSMLAAPGVPLQWWDEHRWSEACRYASIPTARSLALFRTLRAANLALIRGVPARQLAACYGVHERRGRQTMRDFVVLEAAHDLNHLRQIATILERRQ